MTSKRKAAAGDGGAPIVAWDKIDPEGAFRVELNRVVRTGKAGLTILHPRNETILSGKALLALPDEDRSAIAKIEEV